jgi:hypothetical protein
MAILDALRIMVVLLRSSLAFPWPEAATGYSGCGRGEARPVRQERGPVEPRSTRLQREAQTVEVDRHTRGRMCERNGGRKRAAGVVRYYGRGHQQRLR